ncbi:hypothetical protein FQA39_LY16838 [Lamprigera yunnana]|nr:hypothetical protein FQA39_LY16838 [Lamprigera yunnana]
MHLLLQIKNNVKIDDNEVGIVKDRTNNSNISLSTMDIAAQCFIFFLAGYETTASAITFCLYELAANPDKQQKLREEIIVTVRNHNGELPYEAIQQLTYLDMCIKVITMVLLVLLVTITIISVVFLHFYINKQLTFWKNKGIFTIEPTFLIGNAKELILKKESIGSAIANFYDLMKRKSIPYGGFYFLTKPIFVPVDIELIKRIMIHDFDHFTGHLVDSYESDPISKHLFALKGESWKQLRQKLSPAFTPSKTKMTFPFVQKSVKNLIDLINSELKTEESVLEVHHLIVKGTVDVTISTLFGLESHELKSEDIGFQKVAEIFFEENLKDSVVRTLMFICPNLLAFFKIRSIPKNIANFFIKLTSDVTTHREENNIVRKDIMHLLLQIKNNVKIDDNEVGSVKDRSSSNFSLSTTDIAAQCFVFFIAGYETTASTITFCLYELATHSDKQQKVREEIMITAGNHNGELTYDAIQQLTYLDMCIKETLRKYPPLPAHLRECTKDYKIPNSDVILEKGTAVIVPVYGIHHDNSYYVNPESFEPERFSGNPKMPCVFSPFGDGPRTCIGYQHGTIMVKLTVALLLKDFKLTVNPKMKSPITFKKTTFVLRAADGVWLNFEKL